MVKVIISHFNENLDWINHVKYESIVYSRTLTSLPGSTVVKLPNRGREALSYIRAFLDHYHNPPTWFICLHGHRLSAHNHQPAEKLANDCSFKKTYRSFNTEWHSVTKINLTNIKQNRDPYIASQILSAWEIFNKDQPKTITFRSNAQFVVHKNHIKNIERKTLLKWYHWLENHPKEQISALVFEAIWCYMITGFSNEIIWEEQSKGSHAGIKIL